MIEQDQNQNLPEESSASETPSPVEAEHSADEIGTSKDPSINENDSTSELSEIEQSEPESGEKEAEESTALAEKEEKGTEELSSMPLIEHLRELRLRLTRSVLALIAAMLLSLFFSETVRKGLLAMCTVCNFQYHAPTENVITWLRIALILGFAFASPVILYQIVAYVMPALHKHERRYLLLTLPGAGVLFFVGMAFGYEIVLPRTINFLATFGAEMVVDGSVPVPGDPGTTNPEPLIAEPNWNVAYYISFVSNLLLVIGLAFQTPLVVYIFSKIGLIDPRKMGRFRRHAIVVFAVLAAVLTPTPDPFTMFLVMAPMYVLYELGMILARIF